MVVSDVSLMGTFNHTCTDLSLARVSQGSFPVRAVVDESSDEEYASRSHKRKVPAPSGGRSREDSFAGGYSAREAARKPVNYDEAKVDYGLEESDYDDEDEEGGWKAARGEQYAKALRWD
jgi:hypothetical protein